MIDILPTDQFVGRLRHAAFFGTKQSLVEVFSMGRREKIAARTQLYENSVGYDEFDIHSSKLRGLEVIFSTWGMSVLTAKQLDQLPALQAVFYAAGSVRSFAPALLERGITVVSAWQANAIPVAEFTLSQILLSTKGYFRNSREFRHPQDFPIALRGRGVFGETIALLGAGAIGRIVINLLRPFKLRVIVFDPFLSDENAKKLEVEKVTLEEAFAQGYVVSNHLANLPETQAMLHGDLFAQMRQDATFINTGRGQTVDEPAMIHVLQNRPDITALLDVTNPEPPTEDSLLYTLPNVRLSTHLAGSINDELVRMADFCLDDFEAWEAGRPLKYAVTKEMLDYMA